MQPALALALASLGTSKYFQTSLEGMNGAYSVESKVLQRHKGHGQQAYFHGCVIYVSFFRPKAEKKQP